MNISCRHDGLLSAPGERGLKPSTTYSLQVCRVPAPTGSLQVCSRGLQPAFRCLRAPLSLWMGLIVFSPKMFERYVGVFLRGGEAGMSQQFLDRPEIGAPFEKMRRESMTQGMGRQAPAGRQEQTRPFNEALDIARIQPVAAN